MSEIDFSEFLNDPTVREFVAWNEDNPVVPIGSTSNDQPDMMGADAAMQGDDLANPLYKNATMDDFWDSTFANPSNAGGQQFAYGQDQGLQQLGPDQNDFGFSQGQNLQAFAQPQHPQQAPLAPYYGVPASTAPAPENYPHVPQLPTYGFAYNDYMQQPAGPPGGNSVYPPLSNAEVAGQQPDVAPRSGPGSFQGEHPSDEVAQEAVLNPLLCGAASSVPKSGADSTLTNGAIPAAHIAGGNQTSILAAPRTTLENSSSQQEPRGLKAVLPKPQTQAPGTGAPSKVVETNIPVPLTPVSTKTEPAKKRPTKNKGLMQADRVTIFTDQLLVADIAEANEESRNLVRLDVKEDDRDAVAAQPEHWILRITKAFDAPYKTQPDKPADFTAYGLAEWTRWQSQHENKVYVIFAEQGNPSRLAQCCAWIFYKLVLDAHADGSGLEIVNKRIGNKGAETQLKCSERLEGAIKALEEYSIVRYDLLMQERLNGLAASPNGFAQRKVENMWVNLIKKDPKKAVRTTPAKSRKRKAADADEDENHGDQPTSQFENEASMPVPKKVRAASKKGSDKRKAAAVDEDNEEDSDDESGSEYDDEAPEPVSKKSYGKRKA